MSSGSCWYCNMELPGLVLSLEYGSSMVVGLLGGKFKLNVAESNSDKANILKTGKYYTHTLTQITSPTWNTCQMDPLRLWFWHQASSKYPFIQHWACSDQLQRSKSNSEVPLDEIKHLLKEPICNVSSLQRAVLQVLLAMPVLGGKTPSSCAQRSHNFRTTLKQWRKDRDSETEDTGRGKGSHLQGRLFRATKSSQWGLPEGAAAGQISCLEGHRGWRMLQMKSQKFHVSLVGIWTRQGERKKISRTLLQLPLLFQTVVRKTTYLRGSPTMSRSTPSWRWIHKLKFSTPHP